MNKVAVVFWSSTGNTESMADAVVSGAQSAGAEVDRYTAGDFNCEKTEDYQAIAFGCPAMGDEELEEDEFSPMFQSCVEKLGGKKIALFGSYGWGDGEWMRNWEELCKSKGADLICDSVICNEEPDDEGIASCKSLGAALAG